MEENNNREKQKNQFFYPQYPYRGEFTPENLLLNANLQEFAQKVSYICNLETNGKISSQLAYLQIKDLWKKLNSSAKNLGLHQDEQ
jgi:hypothetical protein